MLQRFRHRERSRPVNPAASPGEGDTLPGALRDPGGARSMCVDRAPCRQALREGRDARGVADGVFAVPRRPGYEETHGTGTTELRQRTRVTRHCSASPSATCSTPSSARFPDHEALVARHQSVRYTYRQLQASTSTAAPGPDGPRAWHEGRARRHLGAQLRRVDHHPVRHRQDRRHPRQHQPQLPRARGPLRPRPVGLRLRGHRAARSGRPTTPPCSYELAPELRPSRARPARQPRRCRSARGDPAGDRAARRACSTWDELLALADRVSAAALAARQAQQEFDDPINIQYTSGTTGYPEGRHPQPPQHPQQRLLRGRADALHRPRSPGHPGAALPLLRHGDGQPRLRDPRRDDDLSERRLRRPGRAGGRRRPSAPPRSTACPRCSSPSWAIRTSPATTSPACAPASWPARPARSRS